MFYGTRYLSHCCALVFCKISLPLKKVVCCHQGYKFYHSVILSPFWVTVLCPIKVWLSPPNVTPVHMKRIGAHHHISAKVRMCGTGRQCVRSFIFDTCSKYYTSPDNLKHTSANIGGRHEKIKSIKKRKYLRKRSSV